MATFSEFYAKALANAKRPAGPSQAPASRGSLYPNAGTPAPPESGNPNFWEDPLGASLDFLSRGVYGATNVASDLADRNVATAKRAAGGDPVGAIFDEILNNPIFGALNPLQGTIQGITGKNLGESFVEGLTTDQKDKKRFFSDVIEETTDKFGEAADPNYINRVDNVAGPVKAIAGFAGDVALDPTSWIPIPVGPIVKGARALKGGATKASEALRTAKTADQAADASVEVAEKIAETVPPTATKVTPREALTFEMPEAAPRPTTPALVDFKPDNVPPTPEALAKTMQDAVQAPVAPTPAKIEDTLTTAAKEPLTEAAPQVAHIEAAQVEMLRPEPQDIQQAVMDLAEITPAGTVPGVKTRVTRREAQDAFLAVGAGKNVTPRRKAIYEYIVGQAAAKKTGSATPEVPPVAQATPPLPTPQAPRSAKEVDAEAGTLWSGVADLGITIGGTPLTRDHVRQALAMEEAGALPDEWVSHLQTIRTEAQFETDMKFAQDAMRSELPAPSSQAADDLIDDGRKMTEENDEAAKWLAKNDANPTPEAVQSAKATVEAADGLASTALAAKIDASMQSLSLDEIVKGSAQAQKIRELLDTVEMLVGGEIPAVAARAPIVPGTKGFSATDPRVVSDYAASFDYWVANGLDELADKSGMVEITRIRGEREWTEKVAVSDVQKWLASVNDYDNYKPVNLAADTTDERLVTYGPDIAGEDYDRLLAVDALFREEISSGMVMNPAREAVEIVNILDAWQYLIREKSDFLQTQMGEAGYGYVKRQMKGNAAKVAQRMETLRQVLTPGYGLDNLRTLKNLNRLNKPVLELVGEEITAQVGRRTINIGKIIDERLNPTPVEEIIAQAADPTPTSVPVKDVPEPDPLEAEIVAQPSTITPTPPTEDEVAETLEALVRPAKPQKRTVEEGARPVAQGATERAELNDVYDLAAGELLAHVIGHDIHDIAKVAPHRTSRTRAHRTSETPGEGLGWHLKKYNTQNQYTLEAAVYKKASEISERVFEITNRSSLNLEKTFSKNKARAFEEMYLELRVRVDKALNKVGVQQVIGQAENLVPLSYFDIFTSMMKTINGTMPGTDMAENVRLWLFSNGKTRVAPTNLMDAVQVALWGGSHDEVFATLMKTTTPNGKTFANNFNPADKQIREGFHLTLSRQNVHHQKVLEQIFPGVRLTRKVDSPMTWIKIPGEDLANVMADMVMRSADDLAAKAVNNGWRMEERGLTEVYDMSSKTMKRLDDLYADPFAMAEFMRGVDRISDDIAEEATKTGAYQTSADAASDVTKSALGDDIVEDAERLVAVDKEIKRKKKGKKNTTASVRDEVNHATNERVRTSTKVLDDEIDAQRAKEMLEANVGPRIDADDPIEATEALREAAEIYDFSGKYTEQVMQGVTKLLSGFRKTFDVKFQHGRVWATTHDKALASQEILNKFRISLLHVSKMAKGDRTLLANAWQKTQLGVKPNPGDAIHEELARITQALWSPGEDNLFTNSFLAMEGNVEYVNKIIETKFRNNPSAALRFDIGAAKARSIEEIGVPEMWPNYLAEQWRAMKVDDPLDFLQRMSDAALTVAERRSIVETFLYNAEKWGAVSSKPKPGFVRVVNTGTDDTAFGVFLSNAADRRKYPNGLFMEKELIHELKYADVLTSTSRTMQGEMGDFLNKTYMPILNAWKISITIYRPGHHIRNAIGDASLTWVKRGSRAYARASKDAFRVLSMNNNYTDVDLIKALKAVEGPDAMPAKQSDVIVRGTLNGQKVELTARQILDLTHTKGLRPTFHMGEGLFEDAVLQSKVATAARKLSLQDTKFNEIAGGVSQARDHWGRAQHFIQILHQELGSGGPFSGKQFGKIASLDDLIDRAAAEVKKYHPDASMLTPRESKFFRPLIPFYSWFSKVLPAIAESTLRHPGRVMAFPKASYELAVATGVNPDTIYDPFPEDQLFPSFLTNKALGPQFQNEAGEYFGLNPGISHLDVFNTLGPDPIRGVLGMTSPLFRVPLEIAGGGSWGTGARINDTSDYVDSTIPWVNHLANISGISPTGSLASLLSGNPELDQQYQVGKGNKGEFGSEDTWLTAMNWASGLGAQNMSRPNYINYAELEQKRGEVPTP